MKNTKQVKTAPQRNARGQWIKGVCGCPEAKLKPGHAHRFPPGVSGNPLGMSKRRAQFEAAFYDALMSRGNPDEAAKLLWECARGKEPWAMQLLLARIAPEPNKFKVEVTRGQDEIVDFSRLSDSELEVLERILERARPVAAIEGRALPTELADVH
jgi:hypothetical protein